jgi:fructose-1,6-bisphosphatase/inositol monophosphatase family enzyme
VILSAADINELLRLAIAAAERAASHMRSERGKHRQVMLKQGGSSHASQVVTEVDLESQRLILDSLGPTIAEFELGLLTEESQDDSSRHEHDYFWCIDPLDGTLPFIEDVAGYSVSIALVARSGTPVIGVILDPVSQTLYFATRGGGAFRNKMAWRIAPQSSTALTLVMGRSFQQQENYGHWLEHIRILAAEQGLAEVKTIHQGGAAMNACWVIEHAPAVYFKLPKRKDGGGSLWDFAASACLFGELGAVATDIAGMPLNLNRNGNTFMNHDGIVYASNAKIAEAIYALCEKYRLA